MRVSERKKVLTVVGARPQFIKAAPVSRALALEGLEERLVHTGQHYDSEMSAVFFESLGLPEPAYELNVGSGLHGSQTGRMLEALERVMLQERPELVLVYGDTNSTLAGALCAAKLMIPVAHIEAGLRSFSRRMPEEVNRVLTDHIADVLFAPTAAAVANLAAEGVSRGVVRTGDVMLDAAILFRSGSEDCAPALLSSLQVRKGEFALATVHRAENTDDEQRWKGIAEGVAAIARDGLPVVWPVHPRVRHRVESIRELGIRCVDPLPYFETQALLMNARVVLTDSGGLQKEAAFRSTPCVTLREETEWVELVTYGVNTLAGADPRRIREAALAARWPDGGIPPGLYGDGTAARGMARHVREFLQRAESGQ